MSEGVRYFVIGMLIVLMPIFAASSEPADQEQDAGFLRAKPEDMQWFKDAKFGVFLCWAPASIVRLNSWNRGAYGVEKYDNLYKKFNPTKFDAREWVQVVKDAGARYVVFTTKHHDGFAMFDSKLTDYDVMSTPFGRDPTADLAKACQEAGIRIIWYYSQPDWHHPDCRKGGDIAKYRTYLHGQMRELCTNYGRIDGFWFDKLISSAEKWGSYEMFKLIRELQPHVIINDRGGDPLQGDYATPERSMGKFNLERYWESSFLIGGGWYWRGEDPPEGEEPGPEHARMRTRTLRDCIHLLVNCVGRGGNLVLNTGPMPDGRIYPKHAERYRQMGVWLKKYGESIYATTGGPYKPGPWGVSTRKGKRVYLHVLAAVGLEDGIVLSSPGTKVTACTALTGGQPTFTQTAGGLRLRLAAEHHDAVDTILALDMAGGAGDLAVLPGLERGAVSEGKRVTSSREAAALEAAERKAAAAAALPSVGPRKRMKIKVDFEHDPNRAAMAVDGNPDTVWQAAPGTNSGWLEVDLGVTTTVTRTVFWKCGGGEKIELQVPNPDAPKAVPKKKATKRNTEEDDLLGDTELGDIGLGPDESNRNAPKVPAWRTVHTWTATDLPMMKHSPVKLRRLRVRLSARKGRPSIAEVQFFATPPPNRPSAPGSASERGSERSSR